MDRVAALISAPFACECFRFTLEIRRLMVLPPYKGGVLHGALGNVLRRAVYISGEKSCSGCALRETCIYRRIFEPSPAAGFNDAGRFGQAPRPYVLTPPLTSRQAFHPGDRLEFDLVLIGPALDALPYFVYAFLETGRQGLGKERGRYRLLGVDLVRPDRTFPVYDGSSRTLHAIPAPDPALASVPAAQEDVKSLTLEFLTPVHLKQKGDRVTQLIFPILFERLAQRISLLSSFYGTGNGDPDLPNLLQKARDIQVTGNHLHWYD